MDKLRELCWVKGVELKWTRNSQPGRPVGLAVGAPGKVKSSYLGAGNKNNDFFSDSRTNVSKLGNFVVSHVCLPVIFRFYGAVKAVRGWSWKSFETVDCFPHFHVALKTLAHRNLDGISIYKRNYLYSLLERAKYTAGNFYIPRERSQRQRLLFKWNQLTSLRSLSSAQRLPKLLPLSALS